MLSVTFAAVAAGAGKTLNSFDSLAFLISLVEKSSACYLLFSFLNHFMLLNVSSAVIPGGAVVSAPFVLGAIGFTSAGIAAGSYAASMMSAAAIANGGGVAAGSAVAVLQSAGKHHKTLPEVLLDIHKSTRFTEKRQPAVICVFVVYSAVHLHNLNILDVEIECSRNKNMLH